MGCCGVVVLQWLLLDGWAVVVWQHCSVFWNWQFCPGPVVFPGGLPRLGYDGEYLFGILNETWNNLLKFSVTEMVIYQCYGGMSRCLT